MPKNRKGKKVRHELEDNAQYKGLSDVPNIKDSETGEMISEKEYMRRFNSEWYYGTRHTEFSIIKSEEGQKEATRNNNRNNRDALAYAIRHGLISPDPTGALAANERDFMENASDMWEWQNVYKILGPEDAQHVIFEQTKRDINDMSMDLDVVLSRFIVKMMKLKTLSERRRRQGNKDEK